MVLFQIYGVAVVAYAVYLAFLLVAAACEDPDR